MSYTSFIEKCAQATGFPRYLRAFVLGALMVLTMPPVSFFPLLFVLVPGFVTMARSAPTAFKTFAVGWAFGAGYFIFGLYWVSAALFVDIKQWGWVLPLSLIAGPMVIAIYYGFIPLLARPFRNHVAAHALAIAAAWSLVEYGRGHMLTGFPWNIPGYAWDYLLPVMQVSAFAGVYGLTLLTLCWAVIPLLKEHPALKHVAILTLVAALAGGAIRLSVNPLTQAGDDTVRLVQANIPQANKWNKDEDWRNFERHLDLTSAKTAMRDGIKFVVWPETSLQSDLAQFPEISRLIAMRMPAGATALLGAMRVREGGPQGMEFFNSLTVMDKQGVIDNYDKHHLVPFGEYIPFRGKLNMTPIALAISGIGDFTRGSGPRTLHTRDGNTGFSPLICYETIFPGEVADRKNRPQFLVNVTNDGWYGNTAGPYQHLSLARMRAVEEGLPMLRAANTGISAVFDPSGRMVAAHPLGSGGFVDAILPQPLEPTLYSRMGDCVFFALLLLVAGIACHLGCRRCGNA